MITIWSTSQKAGRNFQNWPVDVFNQNKHASAKTARLPSHNARTKSESLYIWREKTGYTITHKKGHKAAHGYYMITPQNASHPGVSSSRLLYRSENFTPVRKIAPVSRKQIGLHSGLHWWARKCSACVMLATLTCKCILSTWSVPSNRWDTKWPIIMLTRYEIKTSFWYETLAGASFLT